ncbi:MAG: phosphoenolpyruvate carboxykinase (GTP) [Clostridia bacterium]|nr:phosphoenolpyruvate carboxykinase (GTP) [Clostridia bacterium]
MSKNFEKLMKNRMTEESYKKITDLNNHYIMNFLEHFVAHCDPVSVYVCTDKESDIQYVRDQAIALGEEERLSRQKQTIHWDGYNDQGRDKNNTRFLVHKENLNFMSALNSMEYHKGYREIMKISKGVMKGKPAVVQFLCEGPTESLFSIPCVQITDSWYVAHSQFILYRSAYTHFLKMKEKEKAEFFCFVHSAGALDTKGNSINTDQRRVYIDTQNNIVYSINNQYAGNSLGLKKHAMRLAINKAGREDWLCEHMFLMAAIDEKSKRKTYFCGAYPSACGKTSTAMIPGEKIIGDDIVYCRNINGEFHAVNVEYGMFGIIKDVNAEDDPLIFENLMKNQEVIFSNILIGNDGLPYWLGMGVEPPEEGHNHFGKWHAGMKDSNGNKVSHAHGNGRYTMRLDYLDNIDKDGFESKDGVKVEGILYGGRDSDTTVPIEESPCWKDGILLKAASLESETTSATLGREGIRKSDPMANMDFLSYPLGQYTLSNINFGESIKCAPKIFSSNYFMRNEQGHFMTSKLAKKVWLHWAEGRVHGEYDAYATPTGRIPLYKDLACLFRMHLDEEFSEADYEYLFTFRCSKWIEKLERTKAFYVRLDPKTPFELFEYWDNAIGKIQAAMLKYGDEIKPGAYKDC